MKRSFIIVCCIFFIYTGLSAENNIEFSIKNKIFNYLNMYYHITNNNITYNIFDRNKLPAFDLYEIDIINQNRIELNDTMDFNLKITSFFNKNEYSICTVQVMLHNFVNPEKKREKININDNIKIIFKNRNIEFIDIGTVDRILDTGLINVKNSFGSFLKCKLISNDTAEVIQ